MAVATIIALAGGLGVVFMILNDTELEETGVIILGSAIVVGVPLVAYLLDRAISDGQLRRSTSPFALEQHYARAADNAYGSNGRLAACHAETAGEASGAPQGAKCRV